MTRPLRALVVTDSFPPGCGGSGWSTWELVRGLLERGHDVDVIRTMASDESRITAASYEGVAVTIVEQRAPAIPFVRNVAKNEWLWRRLSEYLVTSHLTRGFDLIHAQHVMTTVPSIRAGLRARLPVVATIRDYWPVCYWSDLIYDPAQPQLCPACSIGMMTRCVKPRAGAAFVASWPLIPYMRANLATKQRTLARADAIIAVSSTIARDLTTRVPALEPARVHTIPNPVDMAALDQAFMQSTPPTTGPYVLYAGKLATNKGVQFLLPALARARISWPLVIVGDGPLRASLEAQARQLRIDLRVQGWLDRDRVWPWMQHAAMLAFPSYGPESLSRVLIEAAALGTPIAAMNTGGTPDIIRHRTTGLLSDDPDGFARDLRTLADDETLRRSLGNAARADVRARFASTAVVARVEDVYHQVLRRAPAGS
jgi:glycosyltransferase involved in cell wall biosynthesis